MSVPEITYLRPDQRVISFMHNVLVVSDGTGGTAEQMLRAALAQFPESAVKIHVRPGIRTEEQAIDVVREAAEMEASVAHTLVTQEVRSAISDHGRLHGVETIDLMGPLLAQLTLQFADSPSETPGRFRELNKEYFRRIEAMEFAFRHDDGQRAHELNKADLVLIGVSRTFKTPLSIYLAFKGWLVGNVPIIFNIPPPKIIFDLPAGNVICLTTEANHLSVLRRVRYDYLGGSTNEYADFQSVRRELAYANQIFVRRPDWPTIDVTKKPIEEIASEILARIRVIRKEKRLKAKKAAANEAPESTPGKE